MSNYVILSYVLKIIHTLYLSGWGQTAEGEAVGRLRVDLRAPAADDRRHSDRGRHQEGGLLPADGGGTGEIPLVADMTSELLSRKIDISQFGIIFAGLQKNLGPAGLACVIIREDLLDYALPETPNLLNYKTYADKHSLANTNNTFAIYMMRLVLEWLKDQGGVDAIETQNEHKASILYNIIDNSEFYVGVAQTAHRSTMNVPFNLANDDLLGDFLEQALANGLYALKGHRNVGGARASIYNAMPVTGCEALAEFMQEFERTNS